MLMEVLLKMIIIMIIKLEKSMKYKIGLLKMIN